MNEPSRGPAAASPRVKICCMQTAAEVELAVRYGASAVGLVSEMPSGPGVIDEARIARLADVVPPGVSTFLLTSKTDPAEIADQHRRCGADTLQLCDRLPEVAHARLRSAVPEARLVQVIHVTGPEAVEEASAAAERVDMLLLDTGRPEAAVRELGGTGRPHDWAVSRRVREAVDVPVFLAGGLRPENVARAIRTVRPHGVDVCSGLRPEGELDEGLLARFVAEVRGALTATGKQGRREP